MKVFLFRIIFPAILILFIAVCIKLDGIGKKNILPASVDSLPVLPTVIIDAGHGGADGGSVGTDGTLEKELNLQIAGIFNELIKAHGFNTVMIRNTDISIHDPDCLSIHEQKVSDIHNRHAILEREANSILISFHQNYFSDPSCSGTQVFYSGNNEKSEILAASIQENVRSMLQKNNTRMIKKSTDSIYILYNASKPAVMVECGFISNAAELERLKTASYQQALAFAVFEGLCAYIYNTSEDDDAY